MVEVQLVRAPSLAFDLALLNARFTLVLPHPRSLVPSLFLLLLCSSLCNNKASRSTGAETLDRSTAATDPGVSFTPFQRAGTLARGLESSESSTVIGIRDPSLRYRTFLHFILFTFRIRVHQFDRYARSHRFSRDIRA